MTKILILSNKEDKDYKKISWLKAEFEKREIDVIEPKLPDTDAYDEWSNAFKELKIEITPDTVIVAKGMHSCFTLKEINKYPIGIKGLFLITDDSNKKENLDEEFNTIKKKVLSLFIYVFQNNQNITEEEANELADKTQGEVFVLEGAEDYSDYEDILADILSLEN